MASEQARREEKAWLEDSECRDWLLEVKDAGEVGASLEEPEIWEGDRSFCRMQKISSFGCCNIFDSSGKRVVFAGWCEESTNKRWPYRARKSEYDPVSFRVGLVL
jgi:hypothetical protein